MVIPQIISDPSDCDVYKWSMSNFLFKKDYLREIVGWSFFNRNNTLFPIGFGAELKKQVESWRQLRFSDETLDYFAKTLYWLDYHYIWAYLKAYRFDVDCIKIASRAHGDYETLDVSYEGEWGKVIFFEIFLLSTMTELYSIMRNLKAPELLSEKEIKARNRKKFEQLAENGAKVFEFGTRRRYSAYNQEMILSQIIDEFPTAIMGTSNAYLAKKYKLTPIGTMGHELVMYMAAKYGPIMANKLLMKEWVDVYQGALGIYLTDTYTTPHFLRGFDLLNSKLWDGVREDSAPDTDRYVDDIIAHYIKHRIDPATKTIVHSNGICNLEKLIHMQKYRQNEIKKGFGVGTWLTHDVYSVDSGIKPIDWVIKMTHVYVDDKKKYCVKLSDTQGKVTYTDEGALQYYRHELGL
ncbi:MAG: nicotinate phosphoribosyltransferase [Deferribacteraceae bacterium]|jgi:nicotinate phosphoribosyltransferase|nr:nicotinate phosphoribosyltransferase [Deferribacteraceae bacterium]